jgi:outer membrane receptor protein involved in Fe transport
VTWTHLIPVAAIAIWTASPAAAAESQRFDIPAQRLDNALITLGNAAQISIGGIDQRLAGARSKAVHGRMTIAQALTTMLRGTGFTYQIVDTQTVRIVALAPRSRPSRPAPRPAVPPPRASAAPPPPAEIVVTATKQGQALDSYPGTAHIQSVGGVGLGENQGTAAFIARIPTLISTNLGPGRNKLFVRGIADSSFSGPTQSTVGLYLGDLRLIYNAPEPDLRLYDIDRIEVIEGPQGTLYGAGALGGIVRIVPRMADNGGFHASATVGRSVTRDAEPGNDLGGMLNIPVIADRMALRVVGYKQVEGGYIDNATLGMRNTNRTRIDGARANLRVEPGDNWTIDLNAVIQNIDTRDGQYADIDQPLRTHAANIAQPHDNDFKATGLEIAKDWGDLKLLSSTGIVDHDLSDTFDATGYGGNPEIQIFEGHEAIRLLTHETRLSHGMPSGNSWVAGVSLVRNIDRIDRRLGPLGAPVTLAQLRNQKTEVAIFGEATQRIAPRLSGTLGGRVVFAETIGELMGGSGEDFEPKRRQIRVLPTAALSWKPTSDLLTFLRYQSGFRSGGIAITGGQINSAQRFDSDSIHNVELGVRFGSEADSARPRFSGGITAFYSIWTSIQADLIGSDGLPFTENIGRGTVYGAEINGRWHVTDHLFFDGALFINRSALTNPVEGLEEADERPLPNVARTGGRFTAAWESPLSDRLNLKLDGTVRLIGASSLGTTAPLILEHGETTQLDFSASLAARDWALTLDATNLLNVSGNSFSYGNPFTVALGKQITPLRPRTLRLALRLGF